MAMKNPPHLGHSIKENCLDLLGLNVTEAAKVLGVARHTLSCVLNGHVAMSPFRRKWPFGWRKQEGPTPSFGCVGRLRTIWHKCVGAKTR